MWISRGTSGRSDITFVRLIYHCPKNAGLTSRNNVPSPSVSNRIFHCPPNRSSILVYFICVRVSLVKNIIPPQR